MLARQMAPKSLTKHAAMTGRVDINFAEPMTVYCPHKGSSTSSQTLQATRQSVSRRDEFSERIIWSLHRTSIHNKLVGVLKSTHAIRDADPSVLHSSYCASSVAIDVPSWRIRLLQNPIDYLPWPGVLWCSGRCAIRAKRLSITF